mmetsp:Transcript_9828/g.59823  ORF Transcript_9828/g.59823 Transcript_9828/m.59823 type:complete len:220 (-) Transcript_9828:1848-2507(-)
MRTFQPVGRRHESRGRWASAADAFRLRVFAARHDVRRPVRSRSRSSSSDVVVDAHEGPASSVATSRGGGRRIRSSKAWMSRTSSPCHSSSTRSSSHVHVRFFVHGSSVHHDDDDDDVVCVDALFMGPRDHCSTSSRSCVPPRRVASSRKRTSKAFRSRRRASHVCAWASFSRLARSASACNRRSSSSSSTTSSAKRFARASDASARFCSTSCLACTAST